MAILLILSVLLYDLLFVAGAFKGKRPKKGRIILVILVDVILFIVFSLIIVAHSCNLLMRLGCQTVDENEIVSVLATPEPTAVPDTPTPSEEIVTPASEVQPENAYSPMFVTLFGIVTLVRPLTRNALSPMLVTLFGIVTPGRPLQP